MNITRIDKTSPVFEPDLAITHILDSMWSFRTTTNLPGRYVVGISGGIDSAVVAALAAMSVGPENVYGVMMPNGEQKDLEDAKLVIENLGINKMMVNIKTVFDDLISRVQTAGNNCIPASEQTKINLPARLRMSTLYAIAQTVDGIVLNTCNLSESVVGNDTLFGDDCGSFAPIQDLTKTEVRQIAKRLRIPVQILDKAPADGLQGQTDEERIGMTYDKLDKFIRTGEADDEFAQCMQKKFLANRFKMQMVRLPGPKFSFLGLSSCYHWLNAGR